MNDKPCILYIEDTPSNLVLPQRVCEKHGIELVIQETGEDGLTFLQTRVPDLVLLDIGLPDMDGYEVIQHIRADPSPSINSLKVVALTAHAMNGDRERAIDAGCNGYLAKPYNVNDLLKQIRRFINLVPEGKD